jgi:uncharacterized protein (TIGR02444 family)
MLELYAEPGIPGALLGLQDSYTLDVPFYLAVLHAVKTDHHVTAKAISALYAEIQQWREEVVIPLRAVRKTLKLHSWATRFENTGAFRQTIKSAELNAERIEVMVLEKLIPVYFRVCSVDGKPDILAVSLMVLNVFSSLELADLPADAEFVAERIARNHQGQIP